jgi:hypothetical protein
VSGRPSARPSFWKRGGFYVSKPELEAALAPLREQVTRLEQEVDDLRATSATPRPPTGRTR